MAEYGACEAPHREPAELARVISYVRWLYRLAPDKRGRDWKILTVLARSPPGLRIVKGGKS